MGYKTIDEANQAVIDKMIAAAPFLVDRKEKIPELTDHVLLHAGPPIKYENMTDPMQGSCVALSCLKANNEEDARALLENENHIYPMSSC